MYGDWKPAPNPGPQYTQFMTDARNALAKLDNDGVDYEIAGMLYLQGETDAFDQKGALYEANLRAFIADMRTQFAKPDLLFIIARVRDFYGTAAQSNLVRAAQVTIADDTANVEWFDTDTFNPLVNGGHYGTAGQLEIGKAYANAYLDSRSSGGNSDPVTDPPTDAGETPPSTAAPTVAPTAAPKTDPLLPTNVADADPLTNSTDANESSSAGEQTKRAVASMLMLSSAAMVLFA